MANRKFVIGNKETSSWNPVTEETEVVISQDGAVTYTAKITTSKYDPINEENVDAEYPLTPGVVSNINVDSAMTVKLVCANIEPATFVSCKNGVRTIPVQATEIIYQLTVAEATGDDTTNIAGRQFVVATSSGSPSKVIVGDTRTIEEGVTTISQTGAPAYSAVIEVRVYDPVEEVTNTYSTEIPLGVATEVDFKTGEGPAFLICNTIPGKKFSLALVGDTEIAFNKYNLEYQIPDAQKPPNPDAARQYFIQVVDDTPTPTPEPTVTNNYRLTRPELKEFQKQVYASQIPEDTRKPAWEFVSNVFIVPFVVAASEIEKRENIKARDLEFNIADRLKGNSILLNLGFIDIPGTYGNSLDYYGASVSLYLPFKSGVIDLDPFQVIGGIISIEYEVNPSDGNTTVNIYNDSNELILTNTFRMGSEYPFYSFYDIQDKFYSPENVVNGIQTAYVTVKVPNYTGDTVPKVTVSGNLEGVTGRVDFSEVSIDNIPYADEYDQLVSKLKNGVVIK